MAIKLLAPSYGEATGTIIRDLGYSVESQMVAKGQATFDLTGGTETTRDSVKDTDDLLAELLNAVDEAGGVDKVINKTTGVNNGNTRRLENILKLGFSDASILVHSDSTGNETTEWVYKLGEWYAKSYPNYTVDYYLWDDGSGNYSSPITIQTGTNGHTLSIYNYANSGKAVEFIQGASFQAACIDIPDCDLVYINHGHNLGTTTSFLATWRTYAPRFLSVMKDITDRHSGAGVVLIAQNPRRDSDYITPWVKTLIDIASITGCDVADSHTPFVLLGKPEDLYNDPTHPSAKGSLITVDSIIKLHGGENCLVPNLQQTTDNLLDNGDFSAFDGAVPDGFTLTAGAVAKETTIQKSPNGYSVHISGANGRITWTCPGYLRDSLKGHFITLLARVYIPEGQPSTSGVIALASTSYSGNNSITTNQNHGGWHWRSVTHYLDPADSYLQVRLYGDTSGSGEAYFDRVILCKGKLPKDIF